MSDSISVEIKTGAIVYLRGFSNRMIVTDDKNVKLECSWFDGNTLKSADFLPNCLSITPPIPEPSTVLGMVPNKPNQRRPNPAENLHLSTHKNPDGSISIQGMPDTQGCAPINQTVETKKEVSDGGNQGQT